VLIAKDLRKCVAIELTTLESLPAGVLADGVSIKPDTIPFGDVQVIELPDALYSDDE
jgi:hypothetical protein